MIAPVADYEPPAFGGPPALPPTPVLRRRPPCPAPTVLRGPTAGTPAREAAQFASAREAAQFASAREAAQFADAALRRVLEVMDRRRPPAQLRGLLASGLAETLPAAGRHGGIGAARLRRVRAFPVGRDAAEVAASYTRGERVHAIACRVEHMTTPAGGRWQLVALHIG